MKTLIILLLFTTLCYSQNKETLGFAQDFKMFIKGDEAHNIPKGTINFIVNFESQARQKEQGFWIFYLQMEYTDFGYKRYAAGCGYTFNKLLKFADFSGSLNIGAIDRFDRLALGFEAVGKVYFPINNWLGLGLVSSVTDRRDILYQLDPNNPKGHYFVGNVYAEIRIKLPKL